MYVIHMIAKTTGILLLAGAVIGILACLGAVALTGWGSGADCPSLLSPVTGGFAGSGTDMGNIPEFSTEERAQQFLITHTDAGQGSSVSSPAPQQTTTVSSGPGVVRTWSFDVDTSTFKPDEYLVKASAVLQDATGTALFNVLERPADRSSGRQRNRRIVRHLSSYRERLFHHHRSDRRPLCGRPVYYHRHHQHPR